MSDTYRGRDRKEKARIHYLREARRNDKRGWMKYNEPKAKDGRRSNDKAA